MEAVTFLTHDKYFIKRMTGLSFGRWLFFQVWITEVLYRQFARELRPKFQDADELDIRDVLAFLWYAVKIANEQDLPLETPLDIDAEIWTGYIEKLQDEDIYDELDQNVTSEMGQTCLISAFFNTLSFIPNRSPKVAAGTAFLPMDVIDCILTNDLELSYDQSTIGHPLYKAELAVQDRMIDYLHSGAPVGEAQKDLFR